MFGHESENKFNQILPKNQVNQILFYIALSFNWFIKKFKHKFISLNMRKHNNTGQRIFLQMHSGL